MSKAWLAIPSARPAHEANEALQVWRDRGYGIALWRESEHDAPIHDVLMWNPTYPGYAAAMNALAKHVIGMDAECEWVIAGGDDTLPDARRAHEIAEECTAHFDGTLGVMQPTGDRWAGGSIDRIAGSPWMGREWCLKANGGVGPLWPEFTHMFVDAHLQCVAIKLGIFWQRRDLTHRHNHFCRVGETVDWAYGNAHMPEFLKKANSPQHWAESQAVFDRLKAGGFKESDDLLSAVAPMQRQY